MGIENNLTKLNLLSECCDKGILNRNTISKASLLNINNVRLIETEGMRFVLPNNTTESPLMLLNCLDLSYSTSFVLSNS